MACKKSFPQCIGAIVKNHFDLPAAGFGPAIPRGTIGIVSKLDWNQEPYVDFEFGDTATMPRQLVHWAWLEIIG